VSDDKVPRLLIFIQAIFSFSLAATWRERYGGDMKRPYL
jgi:hypothetical protein